MKIRTSMHQAFDDDSFDIQVRFRKSFVTLSLRGAFARFALLIHKGLFDGADG